MEGHVSGFCLAPLALLVLAGCGTITGPTPVTPLNEVIQLDTSYGTAPAPGWKWGVAVYTTEAQEMTEDTARHSFAWVFYVLRGTTEIGSASGTTVLSAGQATILPAGLDHTHRFPPHSQVLMFRPADRPFGDFHRGTRLWESEALLPITPGQLYRVRVRERTASAWSPTSITADTGFAYVVEGPVVARGAAAEIVHQAGSVFGLPQGVPMTLLTAGTTPVRVLLIDLY
jgi:mannose-6-phosphate isomerase-like protein (cupin superfamily)